ncbi:MAG TPA: cytochrome c biogenesis protein ResB [Actinomycetota bacterium]|nr:cytochrome c biogenesis protein ResB [Actinomycetota bacterium]
MARRVTPPAVLAACWRLLRSMRTALVLLLLLALGALVGSLVPQRINSPARVGQIFRESPRLAAALDNFQLFDVYGSTWFATIYVALLVSLVACLLPRTRALFRNLRARPQQARELDGFRHHAERAVPADPVAAIDRAERVLRRRRFRVSRTEGTALAADKGLGREAGSLLFHWSFLLILVGAVLGKGTGFTGFAVIVEGSCWTEAHVNYDGNIREGRYFGEDHTGVQVCARDFEDTYRESGIPMDFVTHAELIGSDGRFVERTDIRVNHPAEEDGVRFHQWGFGYAPVVEVRMDGEPIFSGAVEFQQDAPPEGVSPLQLPWHGVVELPSVRPQVGLELELWPDLNAYLQGWRTGEFPPATEADAPFLFYTAWRGNLHADLPRTPGGLDTADLRKWKRSIVGEGLTVDVATGDPASPGAPGLTISFPELRQYTVLQVSRDRGVWLMLVAAILVLAGLLPALYGSRRKVWVRAEPDGSGALLEVGGFALQQRARFEEEFVELVEELARAPEGERGKVGAL